MPDLLSYRIGSQCHITDKLARNLGEGELDLLNEVGRQFAEALAISQDVDFIMLTGGQCPYCAHRPYVRSKWLRKHLGGGHAYPRT